MAMLRKARQQGWAPHHKRGAALSAAMLALVLAGWLMMRPAGPAGASADAGQAFAWSARQPDADAGVGPSGQILPALRTGLEAMPHSLADTEVDGQLKADAAGHLVLEKGVRQVFDYFLSLVGEEPIARVRQRIQAYVKAHLPAKAADEALSLLDRYMAYEAERGQHGVQASDPRQADARQSAPRVDLAWMNQRMALLRSLRQRYFSAAEHAAFFGDEEAQDRYTLAKLGVLQDTALGPVDKALRLRQLAEALPPAVRQNQRAGDTYQDLQALTADWQARKAPPEVLHDARVQLVGVDATQRLEALDRQRTQWTQRVQAYRDQKAALQGDASLSAVQREQAVAQLRTRLFSEQERLRLDALEGAPSTP